VIFQLIFSLAPFLVVVVVRFGEAKCRFWFRTAIISIGFTTFVFVARACFGRAIVSFGLCWYFALAFWFTYVGGVGFCCLLYGRFGFIAVVLVFALVLVLIYMLIMNLIMLLICEIASVLVLMLISIWELMLMLVLMMVFLLEIYSGIRVYVHVVFLSEIRAYTHVDTISGFDVDIHGGSGVEIGVDVPFDVGVDVDVHTHVEIHIDPCLRSCWVSC